jgi:hypothetical protein
MELDKFKTQVFIINQHWSDTDDYPMVTFEMGPSSNLESILEAFEAFLIGASYVFPEGGTIGIVYPSEVEDKKLEESGVISTPTQTGMESDWPSTWTISHPIANTPIGSIIPTTFSTTASIASGNGKPTKKKKNGKRKNKSSSKGKSRG